MATGGENDKIQCSSPFLSNELTTKQKKKKKKKKERKEIDIILKLKLSFCTVVSGLNQSVNLLHPSRWAWSATRKS